ncbi:DUF4271 domain-containing protein [Flaviaesturariibacter aridisoli]|uniref:DUF4271 domain-containing protein n=1 Tax=Flaviaesturariibacter aridisoli TaxID=2545761 RepID=A0A4R4E626_9BACT|nr:DUF4271 domain-containing protein [Flaviaesturariibacter aridisoli]TCZ73491.1 DUF4271 domain-containing protein [Flaviaesturariibacter aridisoli]
MKSGRSICLILMLLAGLCAGAQPRDSRSLPVDTARFSVLDSLGNPIADTLRRDTFQLPPLLVTPQRFDSVVWTRHPFISFQNPVRLRESVHVTEGKESLFYTSMGLLLLLAIARSGFPRYLADLFRLFFRANLRQRQAKEQLQQSPMPSLYMNVLYFGVGALFLNLLFRRFGLAGGWGFWPLFGYTAAGLAALYLGKFIVLRLVGWILRVPGPAEAYVFIVFTANKILAMLLLPFVVLLAFTEGALNQVALTLALTLAGGVFAYRYFLSYTTVQRQVRLPFFHFVLYLVAFELVPLLLINKLLFRVLG